MRHTWLLDCSLELIHASSAVARYRQNFPTLSAGTSPRFAIRSSTLGWILRTWEASLVVRSASIPSGAPPRFRSPSVGGNDGVIPCVGLRFRSLDCRSSSATESAICASPKTRSRHELRQGRAGNSVHSQGRFQFHPTGPPKSWYLENCIKSHGLAEWKPCQISVLGRYTKEILSPNLLNFQHIIWTQKAPKLRDGKAFRGHPASLLGDELS